MIHKNLSCHLLVSQMMNLWFLVSQVINNVISKLINILLFNHQPVSGQKIFEAENYLPCELSDIPSRPSLNSSSPISAKEAKDPQGRCLFSSLSIQDTILEYLFHRQATSTPPSSLLITTRCLNSLLNFYLIMLQIFWTTWIFSTPTPPRPG